MSLPRFIAHYQPQAWVDGNLVSIDGATDFDATDNIVQFRADDVVDLKSNTYESDHLAIDFAIAEAHDGPFAVSVDNIDSWLDSIGVPNRAKMSDRRWAEVQRLYQGVKT